MLFHRFIFYQEYKKCQLITDPSKILTKFGIFFIILLIEEHIVLNIKENAKAILILELKVTFRMVANTAPVRYTC